MNNLPLPSNELNRLLNLSEYDIDFTNLESNFTDLNKLAAKIAGTNISLINLIDQYTQWTVSTYGSNIKQTPRNESVCQYTINYDQFEVSDLTVDYRFKDLRFVSGDTALKYYLGVPLTTDEGYNIGALCVMDTETKSLSTEKVELLKMVAAEIVSRLKALKIIEQLKLDVQELTDTQKRLAHDIRGPIGGIVGLTEMILSEGLNNDMDEVLEYSDLIKKSGNIVLELSSEILKSSQTKTHPDSFDAVNFNLLIFKEKLERLYLPQARNKNISYQIFTSKDTEKVTFSKNKLLQIAGNLISNALKFTPANGSITVNLTLIVEEPHDSLHINIKDNGMGMSADYLDSILYGKVTSKEGTSGEQGYGFGLGMVKNLVESLHGEIKISSVIGEGTTFDVCVLPAGLEH